MVSSRLLQQIRIQWHHTDKENSPKKPTGKKNPPDSLNKQSINKQLNKQLKKNNSGLDNILKL